MSSEQETVPQKDVEVKDPPTEETVVDYAAESQKIEEKARLYVARQTRPVIIPSFSTWFNIDEIHQIEKNSLPEFFNNSSRFKTDKIYKEVRNFLVNTFRLNPVEYLTVTAARRNIAADVASIIRIHAFLEQWGLINYQIDPKSKSSLSGPQYTGHFQITLDTPDGLKSFIPENAKVINHQSSIQNGTESSIPDIIEEKASDTPLNLELRRNVYDSTQDAIALSEHERLANNLNTKQLTCYVTGNDATDIRYYNLKSKSTISARAFKEGHFGANFQASDFVRLELLQNYGSSQPWKDQEVLLLLEGVELYDAEWEKIAHHVGTRSSEQCIAKFIQLPIEDKYLVERIKKSEQTLKTEESTDTTNDAVLKTFKFLLQNINPELLTKDFLNNDEDVQKAIKSTIGSIIGVSQQETTSIKDSSNKLLESLIDLQTTKIEAKLSKLSILERQLQQERAELSSQRKELILDRLSLKKQAVDVRNKLVEAASQKDDLNLSVKLSNQALEIAKKAPRIALIENSSIDGTNTEQDTENEQSDQNSNENVHPVSLEAPETYKFWSL